LTDNQGTVRDLAVYNTQTGVTSVANHRVYDSFGTLESQTNAAVDCLFGFTGLPYDEASGTYVTPTRRYAPATGAWLGPDPTGLSAGDTNLCRYVGNSPTNATDPGGLEPVVPDLRPPGDPGLDPPWVQYPAPAPPATGAALPFIADSWLPAPPGPGSEELGDYLRWVQSPSGRLQTSVPPWVRGLIQSPPSGHFRSSKDWEIQWGPPPR
jgi:RHS repeat-associated protein